MRSLWRNLALQWLGGDGSEALSGDSSLFDRLMLAEHEERVQAIEVRHEPAVSHTAMAPLLADQPEPELDRAFLSFV